MLDGSEAMCNFGLPGREVEVVSGGEQVGEDAPLAFTFGSGMGIPYE